MPRIPLSFVLLLALSGFSPAGEDWQKGETILAADNAPADAPLRRMNQSPWFQLSNLQKFQGNFGRVAIAFDFKREGPPLSTNLVLRLRTREGRIASHINVFSPLCSDSQGTFEGEIRAISILDRNVETFDNLEVWIEQQEGLPSGLVGLKVSNSVTRGNLGEQVFARHWTATEEQAFRDLEKSRQPPPAPPMGYQLVDPGLKLLPGMPVLAGWKGEWVPAEIISLRADHTLLIKHSPPRTELLTRPHNWVAVAAATLKDAENNPTRFKPSVRVLPQGSQALPEDYEPVTASTTLVPGTPLKAELGSQWEDLTVAELRDSTRVRVYRDRLHHFPPMDVDRSTLAITKATLEQLKQADSVQKFKDKAERMENSIERKNSTSRHKKRYPIQFPLPEDTEKVTPEMPLKVGTPLAANWGHKWYDVIVRGLNKDGTIHVHWPTFGEHWDEDLEREDLIISTKELAKLKPVTKPTPSSLSSSKPPDKDKELRYRVVLQEIGSDKIRVTKVVAELTGLELKDAVEFVAALPFPVKQNLSKTDAEKVRKQLEDAGAKVILEVK